MRPCGRKWRTRSLQLADLVWNEHAACWKSLLRCHFQIIGSERVLFEMLSGTLYTDDPFLRLTGTLYGSITTGGRYRSISPSRSACEPSTTRSIGP
jgi:hypothetical protein